MKASIQSFIREFKAVVFEKDDLAFRNMSELKALLPLLANQDSNSDIEIKFQKTWKWTVRFKYRAIDGHFDEKKSNR